jgi:hypothetical protein
MRATDIPRRRVGATLAAIAALGLAAPALATPPTPPTTTILFVGDSLAQGLYLHTLPALRRVPNLRLVNATRHATGLTRSDEHDWTVAVADAVARHQPDITVMWIGANDFRTFSDRATRSRHLFGTPGFDAAYAAKISSIAALPAFDGRVLAWIGLPNMRDRQFAEGARHLNGLFEAAVRAAGRRYVDIWAATSTAEGGFRVGAPGPDRVERRLRADDGAHFSDIGYRAVAHLAFSDIAQSDDALAERLTAALSALDTGLLLT